MPLLFEIRADILYISKCSRLDQTINLPKIAWKNSYDHTGPNKDQCPLKF